MNSQIAAELPAVRTAAEPALSKRRPFLHACWHQLVLLNWEVDPAVLLPHLPRGTELDLLDGKAYLSLVGFRFDRLRAWRIPVPGYATFPEVNLRFYVVRHHEGEVRRGVVFIREYAKARIASWVARWWYGENYYHVPMTHQHHHDGNGTRATECRWRRGGQSHHLHAMSHVPLASPEPGSRTEFVVEHYWGYSTTRDGGTIEYRVDHPPWQVAAAEDATFAGDATTLYGPEFAAPLSDAPNFSLLADGSEVVVYPGHRIA